MNSAAANSYAFVDVRVVPMDGERVLPHQTVIVRGDRIARVGPVADVAVPADAVRIDGNGRYLMPGLADMHCHYESKECAALFLANGVTTVRVMWGRPEHLKARARINSGERIGPAMYIAGHIVDGDPPTWSGMTSAGDPAAIDAVVEAQQRDGYDFIKIYNLLSLEVFDALIASSKRRGMPVVGHLPYRVSLEHALESGMASVEHMHRFLEAIQRDDSPLIGRVTDAATLIELIDYCDESKIPAVARMVRESGGAICPTLVVSEKLSRFDQYKELLQAPDLAYIHPAVAAGWDPAKDPRLSTVTEEGYRRLRASSRMAARIVRALVAEGARVLLGTDAQNPFTVPGFSLHEELRLFVDAGVSPYEAIRAGTSGAAEFLGASDEFGAVREGLRADLILLDANPLDDVGRIAHPVGVMTRGNWLPALELARMLDDVRAKYAAAGS